MDPRRLRLLVELSRLDSMHEVAAELGTSTSNVSQGIAALAQEAGTALIERHGRRVRLTPAGNRLAAHAVTILAAIEAARVDLDPDADPVGVVRVAGFATAIRRALVPVIAEVAVKHPGIAVRVLEHEPSESLTMLARDEVDLALVYDYDLAPASWGDGGGDSGGHCGGDFWGEAYEVSALWQGQWGLAVPQADTRTTLAAFENADWIVNSRHNADEDALRTLASIAGFVPRITHRIDALELVEDLIVAGLGVALLPLDQPVRSGVRLLALNEPALTLRAYALVRRGRDQWPPLRAVLRQIQA